jgi:GNAT superfamily N-acetyltransferase
MDAAPPLSHERDADDGFPPQGRGAGRLPVEVGIGMAILEPTRSNIHAIAACVNAAYGYRRVSASDMHHRLTTSRNRVLHVAVRGGTPVGCCSSTLHVPWCGPGVGHWGLLAVSPEAQGTGVASALVASAERRLQLAGISTVQIEYSYQADDPTSERLFSWYEHSLGYAGPRHRFTGFRVCRKRLPAPDGAGSLVRARSAGYLFFEWFFSVLAWICCGRY